MGNEAKPLYFGPLTLCPGVGKDTRSPGTVWGTDPRNMPPGTPNKEQPGPVKPDAQGNKPIWEWQWAQTAMYAYYFADFMREHGTNGFVLGEAQFAYLLTGVDLADDILKRLGVDFRRDYARGGQLRPDIIGFHVGPKAGRYDVTIELLEVTSAGQASRTFREDVLYKLKKLTDIVKAQEFEIGRAFSAPSRLSFNVGPAKWKPESEWQRVVPLPLRYDEKQQSDMIEWICFQPTFGQNDGKGIDGLLLYEIHSLPIKSPRIPEIVRKKIREQEKQQRLAQQVAYGLTLTPWLTTRAVPQFLDRDEQLALATLSLIGGVALIAVVAAPAIAGLEIAVILGEAGMAIEGAVTAARLAQAARLMQATMQTALQMMTVLGPAVANAR